MTKAKETDVVTGLRNQLAAAEGSQVELVAERDEISYRAIVEREAHAAKRLAEINSELGSITNELAVVESALKEATKREAAAREEARAELGRENARKAVDILGQIEALAVKFDAAAQELRNDSIAVMSAFGEVRRLGIVCPPDRTIQLGLIRAVKSATMGSLLQIEHLAPAERTDATGLASVWLAAIRKNIDPSITGVATAKMTPAFVPANPPVNQPSHIAIAGSAEMVVARPHPPRKEFNMPTKLRKLVINEISLVTAGANPGAYIKLFKRDDTAEVEAVQAAADETQGQEMNKTDIEDDELLLKAARAISAGVLENDTRKSTWHGELRKYAGARREDGESVQHAISRLVKIDKDAAALFRASVGGVADDAPPTAQAQPVIKSGTAYARLHDIAAGFRAADPSMSRHQAFSKAYEAHPELAARAKAEQAFAAA